MRIRDITSQVRDRLGTIMESAGTRGIRVVIQRLQIVNQPWHVIIKNFAKMRKARKGRQAALTLMMMSFRRRRPYLIVVQVRHFTG